MVFKKRSSEHNNTLIIFEIFLFEGRLVSVGKGCKRDKFLVKTLKKIFVLVEFASKVFVLQGSEVSNGFFTFLILFNPFSTGKIKKHAF